MLNLLKLLFYLVITVVIIILAGSFVLPGEAVVTRSIEITAPPEKVFAIVGDMHRFQEFSPWAELDPNAKYAYEGPPTGVGQKMSWTSDNANVGSGSQTITEYDPPRHVTSELDFGLDGQIAGDLGPGAVRRRHQGDLGFQVEARRHSRALVRPDVRQLDRRRLRKRSRQAEAGGGTAGGGPRRQLKMFSPCSSTI